MTSERSFVPLLAESSRRRLPEAVAIAYGIVLKSILRNNRNLLGVSVLIGAGRENASNAFVYAAVGEQSLSFSSIRTSSATDGACIFSIALLR